MTRTVNLMAEDGSTIPFVIDEDGDVRALISQAQPIREPAGFGHWLDFILAIEGGYSDHPDDPGGKTNLGITQGTLSEWLGRPATAEEVKELTPKAVRPIYLERYYKRVSAHQMPIAIGFVVADFAVNAGPGRAAKCLQLACNNLGAGLVVDGIVGAETRAAANDMDDQEVVAWFGVHRLQHYISLSTFDTFGTGWLRRTETATFIAGQLAVGADYDADALAPADWTPGGGSMAKAFTVIPDLPPGSQSTVASAAPSWWRRTLGV